MKRRLFVLALLAILALAVPGAFLVAHSLPAAHSERLFGAPHENGDYEEVNSSGCGVERWSVKTGTDPDAHLVNLNSWTPTTILALSSITPPSSIPPNNRVQPTETTQWQLTDTLVEYKLESDSDYHLVLSDGSGNTMIAELPAPSCVGSTSPFLPGITNARAEIDARYHVTTSWQTANIPVQLKGVGFFDYLHGQTGVAPNGIELHPVLDIIFNPSSATPTPTPTNTPAGAPTATPTNTPTLTPTPVPKSTPTNTPTPTSGSNIIVNPGFESGPGVGWTEYHGSNPEIINQVKPHTGLWSADLCGFNTCTELIRQTITVPSNASLHYWWYMTTQETSSTPYDYLRVQVLNTSGTVLATLRSWNNTSTQNTWSQDNLSLTPYAGQTVEIRFLATTDYELPTTFYIDDVTVP